MTIVNQTARTSATGSGATGQAVPFSFPINDTSDLVVTSRVTATGVETVLAETTNYTVVIAAGEGGTLTTVTAVAASATIHIVRTTPFTQPLDLEQGGAFNAENIEDAIDKSRKLEIENKDKLDNKALVFPDTDPISLINTLPSSKDRASKVISCDSAGNITASAAVPVDSVAFTAFGTSMAETATVATARTLLALGWENVKDHAATGDGVTDDTTAVEAALAAGSMVFFPAGTYRVTNALVIPNPCLLVGIGRQSLDSGSAVKIYCDHGGDGLTIENSGTGQVHISGIQLTKVGSASADTGNGIKMSTTGTTNGTGVQVDNVRIRSFDTGLYLAATIMFTFEKIIIRNCPSYGIRLYGASAATGPHDCSFRDVWIQGESGVGTGVGIYFEEYNNQHTFEHIKIMRCAQPIDTVAAVSTTMDKITFSGLMFEVNNSEGATSLINVVSGRNWLFENVLVSETTPLFSSTTDGYAAQITARNIALHTVSATGTYLGNAAGILVENVNTRNPLLTTESWANAVRFNQVNDDASVKSPIVTAGSVYGSSVITPAYQSGPVKTQYITEAGQAIDNAYWEQYPLTSITITAGQADAYGGYNAYKIVNALAPLGRIYHPLIDYGSDPSGLTFVFQVWAKPVSITDCAVGMHLYHTATQYKAHTFYLNRDEWTLCYITIKPTAVTTTFQVGISTPATNDLGVYLFEPCLYQNEVPLPFQRAGDTYIAGTHIIRQFGKNKVKADFGDIVCNENQVVCNNNKVVHNF